MVYVVVEVGDLVKMAGCRDEHWHRPGAGVVLKTYVHEGLHCARVQWIQGDTRAVGYEVNCLEVINESR